MAAQEPWENISPRDIEFFEYFEHILFDPSLTPEVLFALLDSFTATEERFLQDSHRRLLDQLLTSASAAVVSVSVTTPSTSTQDNSECSEIDWEDSNTSDDRIEWITEPDNSSGLQHGSPNYSLDFDDGMEAFPQAFNITPFYQSLDPTHNPKALIEPYPSAVHLGGDNATLHQIIPEFEQGGAQVTHPSAHTPIESEAAPQSNTAASIPIVAGRDVSIPPSCIASSAELMRQDHAILEITRDLLNAVTSSNKTYSDLAQAVLSMPQNDSFTTEAKTEALSLLESITANAKEPARMLPDIANVAAMIVHRPGQPMPPVYSSHSLTAPVATAPPGAVTGTAAHNPPISTSPNGAVGEPFTEGEM